MRRILLVLALSGQAAVAGALATAGVSSSNTLGDSCSKSGAGGAVGFSCRSGVIEQPGYAQADAAASATFLSLSASVAAGVGVPFFTSSASAMATAIYDEMVFITGGTGPGVLIGLYDTFRSGSFISGSIHQGTGPECCVSIGTRVVLTNVFTYGVPFQM